ncbi:TPA: IcmT/TraK family protein [Yersinia enterocolitica]
MDVNEWRNVSRPLKVMGIPVVSLFVFVLWFPFPSWDTIWFCCAVIGFYVFLAWKGYTPKVLYQLILRLVRGKKVKGRPWWYRRYQR